MFETIQKATRGAINKALKDILPRERRDYGQDIRLWNDRDPRVDQSFFQGSVPGFVIGNDQTIVDWNIGFDLVFASQPGVVRGMPVAKWYEIIENFRRLPNREEKLHGEAMIPITDRERVVFISPLYGRMVFMKIMSPVLDRVTGRVIGWNVALNVNSVNERVKFFTDLNDRIQRASRHARFIMGMDQLAEKSKIIHESVRQIVHDIGPARDVLVLGAVGAAAIIEDILTSDPEARVAVMDMDAEALRYLRHKLARHGKRVKMVRRPIDDLSVVPDKKFDAAVILWPRLSHDSVSVVTRDLNAKLKGPGRVNVVSWSGADGSDIFWDAVKRDLESRHEIDLIRWHVGLVKEESGSRGAVAMAGGTIVAPGLAHICG